MPWHESTDLSVHFDREAGHAHAHGPSVRQHPDVPGPLGRGEGVEGGDVADGGRRAVRESPTVAAGRQFGGGLRRFHVSLQKID